MSAASRIKARIVVMVGGSMSKFRSYVIAGALVVAAALSLIGCSGSQLDPGLLVGNSTEASSTYLADTGSFAEFPGNSHRNMIGIQIRD